MMSRLFLLALLCAVPALGQCGPPAFSCISTLLTNPGTVTALFNTSSPQNATAYDTSINPAGVAGLTLVDQGAAFASGSSSNGNYTGGQNGSPSSVNETYISEYNVGGGTAILHVNTSGNFMQVVNTGVAGILDLHFGGFSHVVDTRFYSIVSQTQIWQRDITSDSATTSIQLVDISAAGVCPGVNWGTFGTPASISIFNISQNDDLFTWSVSTGGQGTAIWVFHWSRTRGCASENWQTGQVWNYCASGCSSSTSPVGTISNALGAGTCYGANPGTTQAIHDLQMNGAGTYVRVSFTGGGWTQGDCAGDATTSQDSILQIGTLNDTWAYNETDRGTGAFEFDGHPSDGINNVLGQFFADLGYNTRSYSALRTVTSFYPHINNLKDFHCAQPHPTGDDTYPWVCAGSAQLVATNSGCIFPAQCPTWPQNLVYSLDPTLGIGQLPHTFFHTFSGNPTDSIYAHGSSGVGDGHFGDANSIGFVTAKGNFFCWSTTMFQNMGLGPDSLPRAVLVCGRLGSVVISPGTRVSGVSISGAIFN